MNNEIRKAAERVLELDATASAGPWVSRPTVSAADELLEAVVSRGEGNLTVANDCEDRNASLIIFYRHVAPKLARAVLAAPTPEATGGEGVAVELLREILAWLNTDEVQGTLQMAHIHGYQVSKEFSDKAAAMWGRAIKALAAIDAAGKGT